MTDLLIPKPGQPLKGVTQTILYDADLNARGVYGNCLQAAIATVLELPLDAVLHVGAFLWWTGALELWARGRGLTVRTVDVDDPEHLPRFRAILGGNSPRGVGHCVVIEEGRVVWDPHPTRGGLVDVRDVMWFEPWEHPSGCPTCGHRDEEA